MATRARFIMLQLIDVVAISDYDTLISTSLKILKSDTGLQCFDFKMSMPIKPDKLCKMAFKTFIKRFYSGPF